MSRRSKNQDLIDELARWIDAPEQEKVQTNGHAKAAPNSGFPDPTDAQIIEKCRGAENAAKFADLFDHGYTSAYGGNASDADYALLGILTFWTQDPDQLGRLMRRSALRRPKWDENRAGRTWLRYSVDNAVRKVGKTYDWGERYRYRTANSDSNGKTRQRATSIAFAEIDEPGKPEEVWEGVIVRGWPALWFGGTGVTKSVTALAVAQAIACEHTKVFLGRDVITAPVMYADWELNEMIQGRRAYQIARGRGRLAPPAGLRYMSTYGAARRDRKHFVSDVLDECIDHKVEVCFIDSVGLALSGNPGDFEVIIEYFEEVVADFTANDITPVLIDHQRRLQLGERNQSLGAYGSVWKENLARTQMQIELVGRDREAHTITTRIRPKKTNFGELPEPLGVKTTFSEDSIKLETVEIDATDRAGEETISARDRVLAALRTVEEAGPAEITELCQTLKISTVRKTLSELRNEDPPPIEDTDSVEGRSRKVRLTVTHTNRGNGKSKTGNHPRYATVAELFADPPEWLPNQLRVYHQDPAKHIEPLCAAVAAVVLEDSLRAGEVRQAVEQELAKLDG